MGTPYRINFPFTGNTINWTLNPSMTAEYKKIIAFRNSSAAIRRGTLTSHSTAGVCAFTKVSGTETVFVAVNIRNSASTYTLPAGVSNSAWNNAFTGTQVTTGTEISLKPYEYYVLKK